MRKRLTSLLLVLVLLISLSSTAFACNESQTEHYVTQILFGDKAQSRASDANVKMLLNALYLCSEQHDNSGQEKISYLKLHKVPGVPALTAVNIKEDILLPCSHNSWEHILGPVKKIQNNRKKVLTNTVHKVFGFGIIESKIGNGKIRSDSFAALLYYSHILADYLADDPEETSVLCGNTLIPEYSGSPNYVINGDVPYFTADDLIITEFTAPDDLDKLGRPGAVIALVSRESKDIIGPRPDNLHLPDPTGWQQSTYKDTVVGDTLYDRSHLIGRQFCGIDNRYNLITGTKYLNQTGMKEVEDDVEKYITRTGNHVLYRVTPVFKGDNLIASGVQMEAYSLEDRGREICINRYCYNVQPGIKINYFTGGSEIADEITGRIDVLPFAVEGASKDNPDLMWEMNRCLETLFVGQKSTDTYNSMKNKLETIEHEARHNVRRSENEAVNYTALKKSQYEYFDVLKTYVPLLLANEDFFKKAFK